jgi:hypothetical protein
MFLFKENITVSTKFVARTLLSERREVMSHILGQKMGLVTSRFEGNLQA